MPGNLFEQTSLFQDLDPDQREVLQPLFVPCSFMSGEVIFEQGGSAEYLYLLIEGEVLVRFKPDDGPALIVARIKPDGVVGWSAALGSPTYTSSAVCSTPCRMLRLHGVDLRALCEQHPETGAIVLERLAAVITERLRTSQGHIITLLEQGLHCSPNHS